MFVFLLNRRPLRYTLPDTLFPDTPRFRSTDAEPDLDPDDLLDLIPTDLKEPFDPREAILRIVDGTAPDNGVAFDEFKPLYGTSLCVGWASLHGQPIGIMANARGVLMSEEAQKAAQFKIGRAHV